MLRQIRLEGIKSLLDVTVDLAPLTVLVGPNGCGKSTMLDEIRRVCACSWPMPNGDHNLGAAAVVLERDNPDQLETFGRDQPKRWRAEAKDGASYDLTIQPSTAGIPFFHRTRLLLLPPDEAPIEATQRAMNDASLRPMLRRFFSWRAQRLALIPRQIAAHAEVNLTEMQPDGYGTATILKDLAGNHTQAFLDLQADLRAVVPAFRELRFTKSEVEVRGARVPLNGLELVMVQGRVPAARVSDGTLLALALLTAIHNPDMPDLLLMDDIDHGLHLEAQLALLTAIRQAMRRRPELQILCTTHSPYFLHAIQVEEVRVMALGADGYTVIRPLASHPDIERWRTAMTAGELWANLGESWILNG